MPLHQVAILGEVLTSSSSSSPGERSEGTGRESGGEREEGKQGTAVAGGQREKKGGGQK